MLPPRSLMAYWLTLLPIVLASHLAWEYLQCQAFFVHGSVPNTWTTLVGATFGDLLLTVIAYAGIAAVRRDRRWPVESWRWQTWVWLEALALLLSIGVELNALGSGRWGYTAAAPRLPLLGVSLIPILQLTILFPVTFGLARSIVRRRSAETAGSPA